MSDYIQIFNNHYKISLDHSSIRGINGPTNPAIFTHFEFHIHEREIEDFRRFVITGVEGKLGIDGLQSISSVTKLENQRINNPGDYSFNLEFPINESSLKILEKSQPNNKNLNFNVKLNIQLSEIVTISSKNNELDVLTGFHSAYSDIKNELPHSIWNENILPGLGLKEYRNFALPLTSEIPIYEKSIKELEAAESYLIKGDYDKAVAHCRAALDPIHKEIPEIRKIVESKKEQEWFSKTTIKTYEWLDVIQKQTYQLASKTHHYPSFGHFSKSKAQVIFMITTSILGYIGQIELPNESK